MADFPDPLSTRQPGSALVTPELVSQLPYLHGAMDVEYARHCMDFLAEWHPNLCIKHGDDLYEVLP
jgi:hypothetical protein